MPTTHRKDVLTTGEVARICHVAPRTVSKWFDTGKLRGYRIPGSRDRRIPVQQLVAFMRAHSMPLGELDGGSCRVLAVGDCLDEQVLETLDESSLYELHRAANAFKAGVLAQRVQPHVVVLDVDGEEEALTVCQNIKATDLLEGAKVIAAGADLSDGRRDRLLSSGFDACLTKPVSAERLVQAVEDATNLIS